MKLYLRLQLLVSTIFCNFCDWRNLCVMNNQIIIVKLPKNENFNTRNIYSNKKKQKYLSTLKL